jgi:hypothetical protein
VAVVGRGRRLQALGNGAGQGPLLPELHAIARQLTAFVDDVTAVLVCNQTVSLAQDPFTKALLLKRSLDAAVSDPAASMGQVIDALLDAAGIVSAELQAS